MTSGKQNVQNEECTCTGIGDLTRLSDYPIRYSFHLATSKWLEKLKIL